MVERSLNGDGFTDLLIGDRASDRFVVLPNTRGFGFGPPLSYLTLTGIVGFAVADVDGDGHTDIGTSHQDTGISMRIHWGDSDFAFSTTTDVTGPNASQTPWLVDINADGYTDVLSSVYNPGQGRSTIWAALGTDVPRVFAGGAGFYTFPNGARNYRPVDLDADGLLDFAVRTHSRFEVHWGLGDGLFDEPQIDDGLPASNDGYYALSHADMDGDGGLDVVFNSDTVNPGAQQALKNEGILSMIGFRADREFTVRRERYQRTSHEDAVPDSALIGLGDINSDGRLDVSAPQLTRSFGRGRTHFDRFLNRVGPPVGPGSQLGSSPLPICPPTVVPGTLSNGDHTVEFDVQPTSGCRVTSVSLDVLATPGTVPSVTRLVAPGPAGPVDTLIAPTHRPMPHGYLTGRLLPGLARFEGLAATGTWRLAGGHVACAGAADCPLLPTYTFADLCINCMEADPTGTMDVRPDCQSGMDAAHGSLAAVCRWDETSLTGELAAAGDRDPYLLAPRNLGETVVVELTSSSTPAPIMGIYAAGARYPIAWAREITPGVWRAEAEITAPYAGRSLTVRVTPAPASPTPDSYSLAMP